MKKIQVTEAAKMFGVSRQTLENWGKYGLVKIHKSGKTGKAHWVDEEALDKLFPDLTDYEQVKQRVATLKKELVIEEEELERQADDVRRALFLSGRFKKSYIKKAFYMAIPPMLSELGIITKHMEDVMLRIIDGETAENIAMRYGITRTRVEQIFLKGCRKAKQLEAVASVMDENDRLKKALDDAKKIIMVKNEELDEYRTERTKREDADIAKKLENDEVVEKLRAKVSETYLSVRTINCLRNAGIETVEDLLQHNKLDLLKLRNFGKKSLTELMDFLDDLGLSFGMDVYAIYKERAALYADAYEEKRE